MSVFGAYYECVSGAYSCVGARALKGISRTRIVPVSKHARSRPPIDTGTRARAYPHTRARARTHTHTHTHTHTLAQVEDLSFVLREDLADLPLTLVERRRSSRIPPPPPPTHTPSSPRERGGLGGGGERGRERDLCKCVCAREGHVRGRRLRSPPPPSLPPLSHLRYACGDGGWGEVVGSVAKARQGAAAVAGKLVGVGCGFGGGGGGRAGLGRWARWRPPEGGASPRRMGHTRWGDAVPGLGGGRGAKGKTGSGGRSGERWGGNGPGEGRQGVGRSGGWAGFGCVILGAWSGLGGLGWGGGTG